MTRPVLLLLALLLPAAALARPVTRVVDLEVGKDEFFRATLREAFVDDPGVATVEQLPSGEVMVSPIKAGRTLLYLVGEGRMDVVRLRVRETSGKGAEERAPEAVRTAARKACPGMKEEGAQGELVLAAMVSTPGCRSALRALLDADEYAADRLELVYVSDVLADQLTAIAAALTARRVEGVSLGYSGATLVLKGRLTRAQKRELLRALHDVVVGPVLYEDSVEVTDPVQAKVEAVDPPDAGPPDSGGIKVEVIKQRRKR